MLLGLLAFGSIWFWVLLSIELILLLVFVEKECFGYSLIALLVFVGLLAVFGDINVFKYITENPIEILKYLGIYLVAGILWSYAKFTLVGSKLKRKIDVLKKDYCESHKPNMTNDSEWERHLRQRLDWKDKKSLDMGSFAERIIGWMVYWPISLLSTVVKDILFDFYEFLYHTFLINSFTRIHNYFFKDVYKLTPKV
jgi:hypothetical protein